MPNTTKRILGQLNASERTLEDLKTFGLYPSGNKVTDKPEILFARMDIKEVMEKVNELHPPKEEPKEEKPEEKVVDIEAKQRSHLMISQNFSSRLVRLLPVRQ
mgnify:FL=1